MPVHRDVTFEGPAITDPQERLRTFGQDDHMRAYGRDFVNRLADAGFSVQIDDFAAHLPERLVRRSGLQRNELIYTCNLNCGMK